MKPEPGVQIREACGGCDGTGKRVVQTGAGHAQWSKRVPCPDCDGTGNIVRWITLTELRSLLDG